MIVILGAGLSGLSAAYHLGENNSVIYEKSDYVGGHTHSESIKGFTFDEGPHVSFTENEYVKRLFEKSVSGELLEYPVKTINYYQGNWIPHPAQSNLHAVPQPLRDKCLNDFLSTRKISNSTNAEDYEEWLTLAFGATFAKNFPSAYTRKYWTTEPKNLTTDWVGNRVFYPKIEQVKQGYFGPLPEQTHYLKKIRYPKRGGYMSFANELLKNADIKLSYKVKSINLNKKFITFTNGETACYNRLINTIPLPSFVQLCNAPEAILAAAQDLACSSVLLINVMANHTTKRRENWIYVYDEDKFSTRINCTELLSPNNAPLGKTGIQAEVYFSKYKNIDINENEIVKRVCEELIEMGLLESEEAIDDIYTKFVKWANVIFDCNRKESQNKIFRWLENYGLIREIDDLEPMTDWKTKFGSKQVFGHLILAGRFGQWKYYWTDDCVLRGKYISESWS